MACDPWVETCLFHAALEVRLGHQDHLLDDPLARLSLESITKSWFNIQNACHPHDESYWGINVEADPFRDLNVRTGAGGRRRNLSGKWKRRGKSKGRCKGNRCPSKPFFSFPSRRRLEQTTPEANAYVSNCDKNLLDLLKETNPRYFGALEHIEIAFDSDSVVYAKPDEHECTSNACQTQFSATEAVCNACGITYFDRSEHECSWDYVNCNVENLNVTSLSFFNKAASNALPEDVGLLDKAEWFYVPSGELSGSIPTVVGSMSSLKGFTVPGNKLSGEIPTEFGALEDMHTLDLSDNYLECSIPDELGHSKTLTNLTLRNNNLNGTIPCSIGSAEGLEWLDLSYNNLSGEIPREMGHLRRLRRLDLSNNDLKGPVPAELELLSDTLESMDLRGNSGLSGTLPVALCDRTSFDDDDEGRLGCPVPLRLPTCDDGARLVTVPRTMMSSWSSSSNNNDDDDDRVEFGELRETESAWAEALCCVGFRVRISERRSRYARFRNDGDGSAEWVEAFTFEELAEKLLKPPITGACQGAAADCAKRTRCVNAAMSGKTSGHYYYGYWDDDYYDYDPYGPKYHYVFTPGVNSNGNNIGNYNGGIQAYKNLCDKNYRCKGFNSDGWLKYYIKPRNEWDPFTDSSGNNVGFYEKKLITPNPTPSPTCPPTSIAWRQVGGDIIGPSDWDYLGSSVALSHDGERLWIGGFNELKFHTYADNSSSWPLTQCLKCTGANIEGDVIDISVSADERTFVAGLIQHNDKKGKVLVFHHTGDWNWKQKGQEIFGEEAEDYFGYDTDVSGDGSVFIVGAWGGSYAKTYYDYDSDNPDVGWRHWTKIFHTPGSAFGESVVVSEDAATLIVGSPNDGTNGRVYVCDGSWNYVQWLANSGTSTKFGESLSLSSNGNLLAVGAIWGDPSNHGSSVKIFRAAASSSPRRYEETFTIPGTRFTNYGQFVDVSADGTRLVVAAPRNTEGGDYSGKAFLYAIRNDDTYRLIGEIMGEPGSGLPGLKVAWSGDGKRVAIGTKYNNGGATRRGKVVVYESYGV